MLDAQETSLFVDNVCIENVLRDTHNNLSYKFSFQLCAQVFN